jgi:hypothetical protein
MMIHPTRSTFATGTVRVGNSLVTAAPLWIEPYTAIGVASPVTGGVDVYASLDGQAYYLYAPGTYIEEGYLRSWKARIPARWLKFVGRALTGVPSASALPDGTMLEWGGKS